jgi:hypothetical protein
MAVARRFTIGMLMAIVSLVAADFAIVRALWPTTGPEAGVAIVTLPMIDLLLLVTPKLRMSNLTRPYWVGFQVVGWTGVLTSGLLAWGCPDTFFRPLDFVDELLPSPHSAAGTALLISVAVVLYTTPLLLITLLAGRLSSKYRIVIERR